MSWRHSPAAENLPNLPTPYAINRGVLSPVTHSPIDKTPYIVAADPFTPAQCPDPRRTQRGSRPRGPTPAPSPTAHPTSSRVSCNRRKTRSRLSRLHHRLVPMASPRRRSRRLSACGRRHGLPGWLSRARVWIGGLSLGGGLRIARTRAWFIR
jgi:hypothetical protein